MDKGVLYTCRVMHRRPEPPRYRFTYRSFYLLLDIDAIDGCCARTPLLSHNRFNLLSFYERDYGAHDGSDLRVWIDGLLRTQDIELAGGRVWLLAMPRILGYVFNPISIFYCEHKNGTLRAIVAEVHNTFGEHHFYVLHDGGEVLSWGANMDKYKQFHVSPFFQRQGTYRFRFTQPDERLAISIRLYDHATDKPTLRIATALTGKRIRICSRNILKLFIQMPLMPLKVVTAIYWQALKIRFRGGRFHRKPTAKSSNIS